MVLLYSLGKLWTHGPDTQSIWKLLWASTEITEQVKQLSKTGNLSLLSRTHVKVEEDNHLHKTVLWPSHMYCGMHIHTQSSSLLNKIKQN